MSRAATLPKCHFDIVHQVNTVGKTSETQLSIEVELAQRCFSRVQLKLLSDTRAVVNQHQIALQQRGLEVKLTFGVLG